MITSPRRLSDKDFWAKLRGRKVFQWGFAYVAAAWAGLQGVDFLVEAFTWPAQTRGIATLGLLAGLPIVLTLAWYHGEQGQQRATRKEVALVAAFLLLGAVAIWRYTDSTGSSADPEAGIASEQPAQSTAVSEADAGPSVAVLPFDNRSDREEDAYFVDGIHDDILTQLAKISALRVTARTSVEQFRNTRLPIRDIADRLGVAAVIEGGVQRAGNRVRINIQLIDARTEGHIWAETYDRELGAANIFAIQSEIAKATAHALRATLAPGADARPQSIPTESLEAWEAYQLASHRLRQPGEENNAAAVQLFSQAIERDPGFALAHVGLARAYLDRRLVSDAARDTTLDLAERAVAAALELDAALPEGLAMYGRLLLARHKFQEAEPYYLQALELNPNSAAALEGYSSLLSSLGRTQEALLPYQRLVQLDPLNADNYHGLGYALFALGRFDEALARFRKGLEIDPDHAGLHHEIGHLLRDGFGRYDLAVPFLERAAELNKDSWMHYLILAWSYIGLGDNEEVERWLSLAKEKGGKAHSGIFVIEALHKASLGDKAGARALAQAAQEIDPSDPSAAALLGQLDLEAGRPEAALLRYATAMPRMMAEDLALEDIECSCVSIPLAEVLQANGEAARAELLLKLTEQWNARFPRLGPHGYGIGDVYIHAMRGEADQALDALEAAERQGWRGAFWREDRDSSPALGPIRGDPRFQAVFARIHEDMQRQRKTLAARPSGAPLDLALLDMLH